MKLRGAIQSTLFGLAVFCMLVARFWEDASLGAEQAWRHRYGGPTSLDFSSVACLEMAQYQLLWAAVGERGTLLISSNILDGPETRWTWIDTGTEHWIRDIAAGDKQFLAAGDEGALFLGGLPGTWKRVTNAPQANWTGIARGNQAWAVIAQDGRMITVDDRGKVAVLPSVPTPSPRFFTSLRYGGRRFLASGTRGSLFVSADLANWTDSSLNSVETLSRPHYGSGQWCIAAGNQFYASLEGLRWSDAGSVPRGSVIADIAVREAFPGNLPAWIAVGDGGESYYSSNLKEWHRFQINHLGTDLRGIANCLNAWAVVGNRGTVWLGSNNPPPPNPDGLMPIWWINWSTPQVNTLANPIPEATSIAIGDTFVLGMGLPQWALFQPRSGGVAAFTATGIGGSISQVQRVGNSFMAVGDKGGVYLSEASGGRWKSIPPNVGRGTETGTFVNSTENLTSVHAHGDARICVGEHGTIRRSTDGGNTWYGMPCPTDAALLGVRYGGGRWVAVGENQTLLGSADGLRWTLIRGSPYQTPQNAADPSIHPKNWIPTDPAFDPWGTDDWSSVYRFTLGASNDSYNSVDWNECLWVAVGDQGAVTTSTDGLHWSEPIHITQQALRSVRGHGGRWIAIGDDGEAYLSQDARSWSRSRTHSRSRLTSADIAGGEWVVGGNGWTMLLSPIATSAPSPSARLQARLEWNTASHQFECVLRWPRIPYVGTLYVSEAVDGPFEPVEVEPLCGSDTNEFRAAVEDTLSAFYILRSP